ncbi:MAG: AAA family ATPase [Fuerstiella sp.]|nr:AAA family ATPase [Fuerstiella sp.]
MRILRITVNNIASLAGTHTVDFTCDPLRSAGLYGISGATGAGKSSLLDALCLALFDATPRLKHVGQLQEINRGEKQNNSRTLLRRGTAAGIAEVAFVGVDSEIWTARWSVRRSRNQVDGRLLAPEMTLFRGNVLPGQTGPVEAGGKKTLVQEAIVEKLGLTFDQFTRAVLLAQNEFATFLKSSDRERAEILQTLTGTEQFERISRAVFSRHSEERQQLDALQSRLAGNAPLSADERSSAAAKSQAASEIVRRTESGLHTCESHVAWFQRLKSLRQELAQASEQLRVARSARVQSTAQRNELEQTELAIREASILWKDQQEAVSNDLSAEQTLAQACEQQDTQFRLLKQSQEKLRTTRQERTRVSAELESIQPSLKTARQLDARLQPLQQQAARAEDAFDAARNAHQTAVTALSAATTRHERLLTDQQDLHRKRDRLAAFERFVSEASKWLHLLREAMTAETEVVQADTKRQDLDDRCADVQQQRESVQKSMEQATEKWETAKQQLADAESVEQKFDAESLAEQRRRCDSDVLVLQNLIQELDRHHEQLTQLDAVAAELRELEERLETESATLRTLTEHQVPRADRDLELAERQLSLVEAAVDDHATRLRAALQDAEPCPVCGSREHPYQCHAPDAESAGVHAAKQHVTELRVTRDTLKEQQQRQLLWIESASKQITGLKQQHLALYQETQAVTFSHADSAVVAAILAADRESRPAMAQDQLSVASGSREQWEREEQAYRTASEDTRARRKQEEHARRQWETQRQQQEVCERKLAAVQAEFKAARRTCESAEQRRKNADVGLGDLWSGLPESRNQYETDSESFCETFEQSTRDCGQIASELNSLTQTIQTQVARMGPLEEAVRQSRRALVAGEAEYKAAAEAQEELLKQREQLLSGRAADDVEAELLHGVRTAEQAAESTAVAYHRADKQQQSAMQQLESAKSLRTTTAAELQSAKNRLTTWIDRFVVQYSRQLSMDELQLMLSRDQDWIGDQRQRLKQRDDDVTAAESALNVHSDRIQHHEKQRPTPEEEQTVIRSRDQLVEELKQCKAAETRAAAVLTSDDQRREQNAALARELTQREATAAPWIKLNDLIGSKEGDKFRMIAQRRTLDVLLSYANQQLNQLAVRYRLQRLPESLNLIVIDELMGDQRRSVHSLSGGESFLVSLSLALGLASLTSSRMRIESLFIDEGFGSLDPETLNTAMNALMHLEAQGRKVGVISHVTEMTDAIPVQVQVVKRKGGASKVVVPGAPGPAGLPVTSAAASLTTYEAPSSDIDLIAGRIVEILTRESQSGKVKVSMRALRSELGCGAGDFKAAQNLLQDQVTVESRSLRLR